MLPTNRHRADEPQLGRDLLGIGEAGRCFVHVRAQRRERLGGLAYRRGDFRVDVLHVAEIGRKRDAQSAHAVGEPDAIVARIVRQRRPVARIRAGSSPSASARGRRRCGRGDRCGQRCPSAKADTRARGRTRASSPGCRRTSTGCGWSPRRRCRPRAVPCREATAAAAPPDDPPGVICRIPRIARDSRQQIVGRALDAEFGRVRLAEQHRARFAQARRGGRIDVPRLLRIDGARAAQRRPAARQDQVLDRHRHAVEEVLRRLLPPARLRRPALASAASASTTQNALSIGSRSAMRASTDCIASTGDACPVR